MNRFRRHALPWTFATELADSIAGNRQNSGEHTPHPRHRKEWSWND